MTIPAFDSEHCQTVIEKLEKSLSSVAKGTPAYKAIENQIAALRNQAHPASESAPIPVTESEEKPPAFFQAIGTLKAIVSMEEQEGKSVFYAHVGKEKFRLYFRKRMKQTFLKHYTPNGENGERIYLRVYPCLFLAPGIDPQLQFQAIAWDKELKPNWEKENIFTLRGIWQFIPQFRRPVISVKRNWIEDKKEREHLLASGENVKGKYIPLMWTDPPVAPSKYDFKSKKIGERYFVQLTAKFIPYKQTFGFCELLAPPSVEIPKFLLSKEQLERRRVKWAKQKAS